MNNPRLFDKVQFIIDGKYSDKIYKYLPSDNSYSVIDIACGTGEFCSGIKGNYVGIDLNKDHLDYGKKRYGSKNRQFIEMDAKNLSFPENHFDYAMILNAMHHFSDSDFLSILKNAKRITKHYIIIAEVILPKTNGITKFLCDLDQGDYIRTLEHQKKLISSVLNITQCEVFLSPRKIYTHDIIIGDV